MGAKTKIDWCDSTWNPVTGCLHGCEYCYARGIANRFGGWTELSDCGSIDTITEKTRHDEKYENNKPYRELNEPLEIFSEKGTRRKAVYPYDFIPTLHRYRLNEYINKSGRNIFVCSMADLFGYWVPDSWIEEVFAACDKAPQHNYLFLTKNPQRYIELSNKGLLPENKNNMWFGTTATHSDDKFFISDSRYNTFISIEPIMEDFGGMGWLPTGQSIDWIIVGAETGRRKNKVIPQKEWIENIESACKRMVIPLFMKSSLADIWGEPLVQKFPKGLNK